MRNFRIFRKALWIVVLTAGSCGAFGSSADAEDWPQFRGPGGAGRAAEGHYPLEIGPEAKTRWKTPLPPGHSSPVVVGDRIYVTAVQGKSLVTIALHPDDGRILWEKAAPYDQLERIHSIGSLAQPTPVADDERVISFFGSSGLTCYDRDGKRLWQVRMGPFNNDFGAGTSPILVGNLMILCQDHDTDSFLLALDKRTGKEVWKTNRSEFPRNYCSPVLWKVNDKPQIVIAGTLRVVGYDVATGKEIWTVRGISRTVCMTPVVGEDDNLYVAGWAAGGDTDAPIRLPPWAEPAKLYDANGNQKLEDSELPSGDVKQRFTQIDRNNDDAIDQTEYEYFRMLFEEGRNLVMAIRPGAVGEATDTHVLWTQSRFVPFCCSPLYTKGMIFTVKDGGIVNCLDAKTGQILKTGRLPKAANYYASPVAADGRVYVANESGQLSVFSAEPQWKVLHSADFGEDIYATPALVGGRIYLRTAVQLYCFEN